jgi:hypothetical protein
MEKAVGISKSGMGAAFDNKKLPTPKQTNLNVKTSSGSGATKPGGHSVGGVNKNQAAS